MSLPVKLARGADVWRLNLGRLECIFPVSFFPTWRRPRTYVCVRVDFRRIVRISDLYTFQLMRKRLFLSGFPVSYRFTFGASKCTFEDAVISARGLFPGHLLFYEVLLNGASAEFHFTRDAIRIVFYIPRLSQTIHQIFIYFEISMLCPLYCGLIFIFFVKLDWNKNLKSRDARGRTVVKQQNWNFTVWNNK